jgi:hypothetical protein
MLIYCKNSKIVFFFVLFITDKTDDRYFVVLNIYFEEWFFINSIYLSINLNDIKLIYISYIYVFEKPESI